MNSDEFKPFKPIVKNDTNALPLVVNQPPTDAASQIVEELTKSNTLTQQLINKIDALNKRGTPATAQDLEKVLTEARNGVTRPVNSKEVADAIAPFLQISTQTAVDKINQASTQAAQTWAGGIGFTSPKAAFWFLGIPLLLLIGAVWMASRYHNQSETASTELAKHKLFAHWVDSTYHQVYVEYNEFVVKGIAKPAPIKDRKKGNKGKK